MANVTKHPAVLLRTADDATVLASDQVANGPGDHRQMELISPDRDENGLLTIREIRKVRPEDIGMYVRPAFVTVDMSEAEADLYLSQQTQPAPQDFHQSHARK